MTYQACKFVVCTYCTNNFFYIFFQALRLMLKEAKANGVIYQEGTSQNLQYSHSSMKVISNRAAQPWERQQNIVKQRYPTCATLDIYPKYCYCRDKMLRNRWKKVIPTSFSSCTDIKEQSTSTPPHREYFKTWQKNTRRCSRWIHILQRHDFLSDLEKGRKQILAQAEREPGLPGALPLPWNPVKVSPACPYKGAQLSLG